MSKLLCSAAAIAAVVTVAGAAHAHQLTFTALLNGANEAPANGSPATGTATFVLDLDLVTLNMVIDFQGLTGNTTAAHIHGITATPGTGTAGVMTTTPYFTGFPIGVTSGHYETTLDLTQASSYNPAFVTANGGLSGALNKLVQALEEGRAYLNIHTQTFGAGEIRGFLVPTPGAAAMLGLGGLVAMRRRRA